MFYSWTCAVLKKFPGLIPRTPHTGGATPSELTLSYGRAPRQGAWPQLGVSPEGVVPPCTGFGLSAPDGRTLTHLEFPTNIRIVLRNVLFSGQWHSCHAVSTSSILQSRRACSMLINSAIQWPNDLWTFLKHVSLQHIFIMIKYWNKSTLRQHYLHHCQITEKISHRWRARAAYLFIISDAKWCRAASAGHRKQWRLIHRGRTTRQ